MFGSSILEVAIGLVFVYLLVSLICTAANELISSLITWRARNLAEGIRNLLDGPFASATTGAGPGTDAARAAGPKTDAGGSGTLAQALYDHPLVQGLYRRGRAPSYIPSRTFALALLDIVYRNQQERPTTIEGIRQAIAASGVNDDLKRVLLVLLNQTADTVEAGLKLKENGLVDAQRLETAAIQFRENVEGWFNDSMERVAGWYKRKIQALSFGVAALLVVALNVDTIAIAKSFAVNSTLRESVVAEAQKLAAQPPPSIAAPPAQTVPAPQSDAVAGSAAAFTQLQDRVAKLEDLSLPLGWSALRTQTLDLSGWLTKLVGLLLTAAAASLGAPFWFDVLNKIVTVRSSGKAPEETPKAPKEIPRPMAPTAAQPPPVSPRPSTS